MLIIFSKQPILPQKPLATHHYLDVDQVPMCVSLVIYLQHVTILITMYCIWSNLLADKNIISYDDMTT